MAGYADISSRVDALKTMKLLLDTRIMLIAQAISEPLHLLTHDKNVSRYSESIILV